MVGRAVSKALEDHLLNVEIFVGCLNDEVCCLERVDVLRVGDPVGHILLLIRGHALLSDFLLAPVVSEVSALVKAGLSGVHHGDVEASNTARHDTDASAHLTGTNHTNVLDREGTVHWLNQRTTAQKSGGKHFLIFNL